MNINIYISIFILSDEYKYVYKYYLNVKFYIYIYFKQMNTIWILKVDTIMDVSLIIKFYDYRIKNII